MQMKGNFELQLEIEQYLVLPCKTLVLGFK